MSPAVKAITNTGKGIGLVILLFFEVYAPVSAAVAHMTLEFAVPIMIGLSFGVAVGLIAFFIRARWMFTFEFGLSFCPSKHIIVALIVGLPLGFTVSWLTGLVNESGPLIGLSIPTWLSIMYFGIGAPIQEELIFRGLLQSVLAKTLFSSTTTTHVAPLIIAILFGAIHAVVGPVTAICAFVLGVAAGELRLRSGSLVPAVIVHALFNLCGIVWMRSWAGT